MKIDFGRGEYIDTLYSAGRPTILHKRVVKAVPLKDSKTGYRLTLECGHQAEAFDVNYPTGRMVLCTECRDLSKKV